MDDADELVPLLVAARATERMRAVLDDLRAQLAADTGPVDLDAARALCAELAALARELD